MPFGIHEPDRDRNDKRMLHRLPRRGRSALARNNRIGARFRIPVGLYLNPGRTGLAVPEEELFQIAAIRFGHGVDEVFAGGCTAVVPLNVERQALLKALFPEHGLKHAVDFRTLLIHGHRVEIVDLTVAFRPDRMSHRTRIFRELTRAEGADIHNALDDSGLTEHIARELLIAEDGEAFLQRELEPVSQSDPVARPVMEVFVTDNGFNIEVIEVRRHLRCREHIARIEDVQALILHGSEIEVVGSDKHEAVQVILESPAGFIPVDGSLDALHCVLSLISILRLNPDRKQAVLAVCELIDFLTLHQLSGDKREEVAGLERGIFPDGEVPSVIQISLLNEVAV